jgi:hypothetical protein
MLSVRQDTRSSEHWRVRLGIVSAYDGRASKSGDAAALPNLRRAR